MDIKMIGVSMLVTPTRKHVILFDSDLEIEIRNHSWCVNNDGYVVCSSNSCGYTFMHQFVLEFSGDGEKCPDHINRIKTDNRRCNLRIVSYSENNRNRKIRDDDLNKTAITMNQMEFLEYAHEYMESNKIFPTYREIMKEFDFKSPNSVTQYIKSLNKKGFLVRDPIKKHELTEMATELII